MKTITDPVAVAQTINNINRWQVLRAIDHDDVTPPWMEIVVQAIGSPNARVYPSSGSTYTLVAFDAQPSLILDVNPSPLAASDQLYTHSVQLSGTAYTTISAANTGARNTARMAVESACLTTGLVASGLAGA